MILSPVFGWIKDRIGSRIPTTVGLLSVVPFLWLSGLPGDERFEWVNADLQRGKAIYAGCMALIGCSLCLLNGVGPMEVMCKCSIQFQSIFLFDDGARIGV